MLAYYEMDLQWAEAEALVRADDTEAVSSAAFGVVVCLGALGLMMGTITATCSTSPTCYAGSKKSGPSMSAEKAPNSAAFPWRVIVGWEDIGCATEAEANECAAEQAVARPGFEVRVYLLERDRARSLSRCRPTVRGRL